MTDQALASLRSFAASRPVIERCELCAEPLPSEHEHLLDPRAERLRCACVACALLFAGADGDRPRRVESFSRRVPGLELDDATWYALGVPVGLAFIIVRGASGDAVASLPGRAGVVETTIPKVQFRALAEKHPLLGALAPDIEALLVRRTPGSSDYFHASVDHCFRLAGLLRSEPGPMSGPEPALVDDFFRTLEGGA